VTMMIWMTRERESKEARKRKGEWEERGDLDLFAAFRAVQID